MPNSSVDESPPLSELSSLSDSGEDESPPLSQLPSLSDSGEDDNHPLLSTHPKGGIRRSKGSPGPSGGSKRQGRHPDERDTNRNKWQMGIDEVSSKVKGKGKATLSGFNRHRRKRGRGRIPAEEVPQYDISSGDEELVDMTRRIRFDDASPQYIDDKMAVRVLTLTRSDIPKVSLSERLFADLYSRRQDSKKYLIYEGQSPKT